MSFDGKHQMRLRPPEAIMARLGRVRSAGGRVWLVGGAVRDAFLGVAPEDWDFATNLEPEAVANAVAQDPSVTLQVRDAHLGVLALEADSLHWTITSLRREAGYRDFRRPDQVSFVTDVAVDAARRDFSMNALYWDVFDENLEDPCGGLGDLAFGRLRLLGDPRVRFVEDPLRMLRAVRFAGRFALSLDERLREGLEMSRALLSFLALERVYDELTRAITGEGRGRYLRLLVDTGLAEVVLPEVPPMDGVPQPPEYHPEGDVLTHVVQVLDNVPGGDPTLAWAAVLHDVGKPPTFERAADRIRFSGHDRLSATMAEKVLHRLRAPRELRETVVEICRDHIRMAAFPDMRRSTRDRWLRSPRFPAHLAFHRADCLASHGGLAIWEEATTALAELPPEPEPPVLTGKDLIALGVAPGPRIGALLKALEEHLDGVDSRDRDVALAWVRQRLAEEDAIQD